MRLGFLVKEKSVSCQASSLARRFLTLTFDKQQCIVRGQGRVADTLEFRVSIQSSAIVLACRGSRY